MFVDVSLLEVTSLSTYLGKCMSRFTNANSTEGLRFSRALVVFNWWGLKRFRKSVGIDRRALGSRILTTTLTFKMQSRFSLSEILIGFYRLEGLKTRCRTQTEIVSSIMNSKGRNQRIGVHLLPMSSVMPSSERSSLQIA